MTPVSFESDRFHYADTLDLGNLLTVINPTSSKELP